MEKALYLILTLYGIFSQGICHVSEENNEKSTNLQIRQKRVAGGSPHALTLSPYIVVVLLNGNYQCPATLLTDDVAISSASCFVHQNPQHMMISSRTYIGTDQLHVIQRLIFLQPNFNGSHPTIKNLVLVRFSNPINYTNSPNRPISIYSGVLTTQNLLIDTITWGRPLRLGARKIPSTRLRKLSVHLVSIEYCQGIYQHIIGAGNICTVGQVPGEYVENGDSGSPTVAGNYLLGLFVYHGDLRRINPDVHMNLLDHDIRRWIHEHIPSLRLF